MDAIIVGAGPNGLAAAIAIAQTGRRVVVYEAHATVGGGARSAESTLPGFVHDICSAVHPLAVASPFFRTLPLAAHGLEWVEPPVMVAHPMEDGSSPCLYRSLDQTVAALGDDGEAYRRLVEPLIDSWPVIESAALGSLRLPRRPLGLGRLALRCLQSAERLAAAVFRRDSTRALLAGIAAHSMLPLDFRPTAGVGLVLAGMAHVGGWVMPRGGAQRLSDALAAHLRSLGGEIVTNRPIASLDELPPARAVLCDLSPQPLLRIAGHRFPPAFQEALRRYRYGMGAFKVDWALERPIPWRSLECARAGTVHLGGALAEIAASERDAWNGRHAERPFTLLAQPTLFDDSRAPRGRHTAWTYCHVPHASTTDMVSAIERQIERYAPGFRNCVIARAVTTPADFERDNPNLVGGDIGTGVSDMRQMLARPTWRTYSTPVRGLYICSAATPPGVGVHGMCGYFAARRALREVLAG